MLEFSNRTLEQCFQELDHIKYKHLRDKIQLRNKIQLVSRHVFNSSEKKPQIFPQTIYFLKIIY